MSFQHNPQYELPKVLLPHDDDIMLVSGTSNIELSENGLVKRIQSFWTPETKHFFEQANLRWMLVIESLAQAGAAALYQEAHDAGVPQSERPSPLFGGIRKAEFGQDGRSVVPGDTVSLEVDFENRRGETFMGRGVAKVGEDTVCETTFTGILMDPQATDEFYNGLSGIGVSAPAEEYHERAITNLPRGVFSGNSRGIWVDEVFVAEDLSFATGNLFPSQYQFMGHAFGEKRDETGLVVRPATPLFPGIKSVGFAEDVTRAARPDLDLIFKGLQRVRFTTPVQEGHNLTAKTDFTIEGDQLVSNAEVRINGLQPDNVAASAKLLFEIAAYR